MARSCSTCGNEVLEGASFCGGCGRSLSEEESPVGREASPPQVASIPQDVPSTGGQAFAPPALKPEAPSISVPPSPQRQTDARAARIGHSRLGIASFAVSLLTGLLWAYTFSLAIASEVADLTLGDLGIACIFTTLVALGLGIAGLAQRQRKRLIAILGIVVSTAGPFVVFGIFYMALRVG